MAKFKTEGGGKKADPYDYLRHCAGCQQPMRLAVYFDETGRHDVPSPDGKPIRLPLALWDGCNCETRKPSGTPEGWRRAANSEVDPVAWAALDLISPPFILTCGICRERKTPAAIWEPGKRQWEQAGDYCRCTREGASVAAKPAPAFRPVAGEGMQVEAMAEPAAPPVDQDRSDVGVS